MPVVERLGFALVVCFSFAFSTATHSDGEEVRPNPSRTIRHPTINRLKGVDLGGRVHRFGENGDTKAFVITFLSVHCPISNGYLPQLGEMASNYQRQGIEFYGVISDPSVTRAEATLHSKSYKIEFPVLFDASNELRIALTPTHTPQTIVVDRKGKKVYSGAIDNRYVQLGRKKEAATEAYLENAIRAVISGGRIAVPSTKPIGCLLEEPPNKSEHGSVTYSRDIAPIIQANCASCHRPDQSAPFPLLSYDDVSAHANQILEVTQSRFMPPWKPAPGFTRFLDEMRLTQRELSLLNVWVQSGKPQGDPDDLPEPIRFAKGWQLGKPDLILQMKDVFPIPASGPDIRQYFVIPTHLTRDRLVSAIEFQPGVPQAVHHASFYLDPEHVARRLDQKDPAPGYAGFGGPKFQTRGTLNSWFPGMTPRRLPHPMGRYVAKGTDIVAELHYVTTGKREQDQSKIGIYFADSSANTVVAEIQVGNRKIKIPPGDAYHHERAVYTLPVDTMLLDVIPHMHVLGREMKVWSRSPDGKTKPLIWIKDWDFNWQGQYVFADSVHLPKGTKLFVDAWFDNSADNPLNPNSPPVTVRWGDNSTDEMLLCHFQCTCKSVDELEQLVGDQQRYIADAKSR